ncbi:hypothetical protein R3P38DRAFT_3169542 [Favolaschia claudopus]|uniref:Uncharacterized protein n=1 Tax=Favolaschia claudopus TaxID=2862362 RepID=A0AAW0E349_9AGAR
MSHYRFPFASCSLHSATAADKASTFSQQAIPCSSSETRRMTQVSAGRGILGDGANMPSSFTREHRAFEEYLFRREWWGRGRARAHLTANNEDFAVATKWQRTPYEDSIPLDFSVHLYIGNDWRFPPAFSVLHDVYMREVNAAMSRQVASSDICFSALSSAKSLGDELSITLANHEKKGHRRGRRDITSVEGTPELPPSSSNHSSHMYTLRSVIRRLCSSANHTYSVPMLCVHQVAVNGAAFALDCPKHRGGYERIRTEGGSPNWT